MIGSSKVCFDAVCGRSLDHPTKRPDKLRVIGLLPFAKFNSPHDGQETDSTGLSPHDEIELYSSGSSETLCRCFWFAEHDAQFRHTRKSVK